MLGHPLAVLLDDALPHLRGWAFSSCEESWLRRLAGEPVAAEVGSALVELRPGAGEPLAGLSVAPMSRGGDPGFSRWLEYDWLPAGAIGQPAVFLGVGDALRGAEATGAALAAELETIAPERPGLAAALPALLEALRGPGSFPEVEYAGVMAGRADTPLRVNVRGVHPDALAAWRPLPSELPPLLEAARRWVLAVDLGPHGPSERWGVELFPALDGGAAEWTPLLEMLAGSGLLAAGALEPLLAWNADEPVPDGPAACLASLLSGPGAFRAWRRLNHAKLVVRPGHAPECKVYLAFGRTWTSRRATASPP